MRNAEETKFRLLETAIALVWQSSYSNVGVNEICKRAGVTKGAFYHHFESKADLYYQASHHYWELMKPSIDTVLSKDVSALEQLESFINFICNKNDHKIVPKFKYTDVELDTDRISGCCPFFTSGNQSHEPEEKVKLASIEMTQRACACDTELVEKLQAEDVISSAIPAQTLGPMIFQFVHGCLNYAELRPDPENLERDIRLGLYRILQVPKESQQKH